MKAVIYYFSGTGNSLRAARIIAGEIGGAELVSVRNPPEAFPAGDADVIGFICPAYEWDVPEPMKRFAEKLEINPNAYTFMVSTYVAVHGRSFETLDAILRQKGSCLQYGKALRCVASQCTAYEPFPSPRIMVPRSDKQVVKIGQEIANRKLRTFPHMSPISRRLYSKMMTPFMNVQHEYDKGFYASAACIGCELCRKICPCDNITFDGKQPVWNHRCIGCNACVVYCPTKAIQFKTPEAYARLNNVITKKLGLPENRTRYHNPHISAADMVQNHSRID